MPPSRRTSAGKHVTPSSEINPRNTNSRNTDPGNTDPENINPENTKPGDTNPGSQVEAVTHPEQNQRPLQSSRPTGHENLPSDRLLSTRQESFCLHYAESGNAAAAARAAGYAPKWARQQGHENLTKPDISARIEEIGRRRAYARRKEVDLLMVKLQEVFDAAMSGGRLNAAVQALTMQARLSGVMKPEDEPEVLPPGGLGAIARSSLSGSSLAAHTGKDTLNPNGQEPSIIDRLILRARRALGEGEQKTA